MQKKEIINIFSPCLMSGLTEAKSKKTAIDAENLDRVHAHL